LLDGKRMMAHMALRFDFLVKLVVDVGELVSMGSAPLGERRVVNILGGTFKGVTGIQCHRPRG
jgi:hypothetical protein